MTPTKKPATQQTEIERAKPLRAFFSKYSLAAITPDLVARYRDMRLATALKPQKKSKSIRLLSASTVRLELALLGHLFTTAIREWRLGLAQNPVALVRKPKSAEGRDRRLEETEEQALMRAVDAHSNPMLGWIVRIAVETGMRSGEILGLRLSQVDLKRRIVRLSDTKNDSARTRANQLAAAQTNQLVQIRALLVAQQTAQASALEQQNAIDAQQTAGDAAIFTRAPVGTAKPEQFGIGN